MSRTPRTIEMQVLSRIAAGEFRADIARSCCVSEYSVTMIAKRHGVTVAKCPTGSRWGKFGVHYSTAPMKSEAEEWRAKAWASRRFAGSGYPT